MGIDKKKIASRMRLIQGDRRLVDFARDFGENVSTMANYLTGERYPSFDLLEKFFRAGVNLNWLITGEEDISTSHTKVSDLSPEVQHLIKVLANDADLAKPLTELAYGMLKAKQHITRKAKK